jgi:hypothetical protein
VVQERTMRKLGGVNQSARSDNHLARCSDLVDTILSELKLPLRLLSLMPISRRLKMCRRSLRQTDWLSGTTVCMKEKDRLTLHSRSRLSRYPTRSRYPNHAPFSRPGFPPSLRMSTLVLAGERCRPLRLLSLMPISRRLKMCIGIRESNLKGLHRSPARTNVDMRKLGGVNQSARSDNHHWLSGTTVCMKVC